MGDSLQTFKHVINRASKAPDFPVEAKIALMARIDYAVSRGDITMKEAELLDAEIGQDLRDKYHDVLEMAAFGDLEEG